MHRNAKLVPFGRFLLVQRVVHLNWPVSQAAASLGISREIAYKWLRRWQQEGVAGLEDRSTRPHTSPRITPQEHVEQIRALRLRLRWGPHRLAPLIGKPRSTIYAVLRREGLSRLQDLDRSTGVPIRYVRDHPGELIHIDMKPLGRIPRGGGHRIWGDAAPRHNKIGHEALVALSVRLGESWRTERCSSRRCKPRVGAAPARAVLAVGEIVVLLSN